MYQKECRSTTVWHDNKTRRGALCYSRCGMKPMLSVEELLNRPLDVEACQTLFLSRSQAESLDLLNSDFVVILPDEIEPVEEHYPILKQRLRELGWIVKF